MSNDLVKNIGQSITDHWQFVFGGILYFVGKDILDAAQSNYWAMHTGLFLQDISLYVIGFKAVSGAYTPPINSSPSDTTMTTTTTSNTTEPTPSI